MQRIRVIKYWYAGRLVISNAYFHLSTLTIRAFSPINVKTSAIFIMSFYAKTNQIELYRAALFMCLLVMLPSI